MSRSWRGRLIVAALAASILILLLLAGPGGGEAELSEPLLVRVFILALFIGPSIFLFLPLFRCESPAARAPPSLSLQHR